MKALGVLSTMEGRLCHNARPALRGCKGSINVAQNDTHLVWIDMEMSGLEPDRDSVLEVALIVTDKDLNLVEEGPVLVVH